MPAFAWSGVSAGPWHWPQLEASTFSAAALARAAGSLLGAVAVGALAGPAPALLAGAGVAAGQPASNGLSSQVSRWTGATSELDTSVVAGESLPPLLLLSSALQARAR